MIYKNVCKHIYGVKKELKKLYEEIKIIPWEEFNIFVRKYNLIKPLDFEKFNYQSLDK